MKPVYKRVVFYLLFLFVTLFTYRFGRSVWVPVYKKINGQQSLADVIAAYGEKAENRLLPFFQKAGVAYPPPALAFLTVKESESLELWAKDKGRWIFVKDYSLKAKSGTLGPKLNEGDRQIPEGVYQITNFNPNSSYHLSMRLNYPNEYDLKMAAADGRKSPGSDIYIHGNNVSIGCLAMGDAGIEELFILTHLVGKENVELIIAPQDPRLQLLQVPEGAAVWVNDLYESIARRFLAITGKE